MFFHIVSLIDLIHNDIKGLPGLQNSINYELDNTLVRQWTGKLVILFFLTAALPKRQPLHLRAEV